MSQTNRTPGQAEGTEEAIDAALSENRQQQASTGKSQQNALEREPGTTPGQAEGAEEHAEGSRRRQK